LYLDTLSLIRFNNLSTGNIGKEKTVSGSNTGGHPPESDKTGKTVVKQRWSYRYERITSGRYRLRNHFFASNPPVTCRKAKTELIYF
jgi:hypothetical protein